MSDFIQTLKGDKQRFLSAAVLIAAVVLIGFFNNFFIIWLVLGGLYILAFFESLKLFGIQSNSLYIYAIVLWLGAFIFPNPAQLVFLVLIALAGVLAYKQSLDKKLFLPFLYPSVGFLFILSLYSTDGIKAIFWLIFIVASTDVGAYLIGKSIGKTPFSPTSPNKTLEGVGGGFIAGLVVGSLYGGFVTDFFGGFLCLLL